MQQPFVRRQDLYRAVKARDGGRCVRCRATADLTIHHIRPRTLGGTHHHRNLVTLCRSCHDAIEQPITHWTNQLAALLVWLVYGPRFLVARRRTAGPSEHKLSRGAIALALAVVQLFGVWENGV